MNSNLKTELLNSLTLIPTADNTQPWKIQCQNIGTNYKIELFHSGNLAKHTLNSQGVASLFSMGFLLEVFELTGKKCGYKMAVQFHKNNWSKLDSELLIHVASICFELDKNIVISKKELELFQQLAIRHTNRNLYKKHVWSEEVFKEINQDSCKSDDVKIRYFSSASKSVVNYVAKTESILWKETKILSEILNWVRFSNSDIKNSKNGLNGKGLGFKGLEWGVVKFVVQNKFVLKFVRPLIANIIAPLKTKKQLYSSTALAAVTVSEVNYENLIQSGRQMMSQWLMLTQMGYVIHPYTLGSLNIFNEKNNTLSDLLKKKYLQLFQSGNEIFQKAIGISNSETVVFFFRLGRAAELSNDCKSKKQSADYFLINTQDEISILKNQNQNNHHIDFI